MRFLEISYAPIRTPPVSLGKAFSRSACISPSNDSDNSTFQPSYSHVIHLSAMKDSFSTESVAWVHIIISPSALFVCNFIALQHNAALREILSYDIRLEILRHVPEYIMVSGNDM